MTRAERAKQNFLAGANCAQAVLCAFEEEIALDHETAMKLASGFGGGMARMREVCGAVSGMFIAADLILGPSGTDSKTAKDSHYAFLQNLAAEFKAETGSIICRVMLGIAADQPADSPVSEARTPAYYRKRPCAELCALAAEILERHLRERAAELRGN